MNDGPLTKRDLKETEVIILKAIEGGRQQQSAEHGEIIQTGRTLKQWIIELLDRFGFLKGGQK